MTNLGTNFYAKLVQVASELNMKPEDILAVMVSESGIKPEAVEKKYHGSGLIGFMPSTLKNLGYQGSWQEFSKTSGEEQLDYVKKYIQSKIPLNGGPFKSAAQYYIANFYPVALKLPGIKAGDPDTIFLEQHPATVIGKDGRRYSKKYYDIGFKINPASEAEAYTANPLFHGKTPGAITYGDMMQQVDKNKKSTTYRQALTAMHNTTGYQASPNSSSTRPSSSGFGDFIAKLTKLLGQFAFASETSNNFLVSVGSSSDYASTIEYARILSAAIEEYFEAKVEIHADKTNVEIECKIAGDKKILFDALKELSTGVSDAFKHATKDVDSITTFALITVDSKSEYEPLHPRTADLYYRKFQLKFARSK